MTEYLGKQIGNYRLVRALGSGGFADVYLGEHVYLRTQAAIKMLQARLAQENLATFLQEAQTIASLTHPNIIQVFDFGVEENAPFLVMAYAPNGTLRQRHAMGTRLSLAEVVTYTTQVAEALHYAHGRKIIHRDVKPENMLIGQDGKILLSDFGIAVVSQSSRYQGKQEIGGTVAYMAPEQLQGHASPASDQYALGVVVYEWLTGQRPFDGSFAEIGSQHLFTPPPSLLEKVPDLPPDVEQAIFIALNKDPQKRFLNVKAFASALAQCQAPVNNPIASPGFNEEDIPTVVKTPAHPAYGPPGSSPMQPANLNFAPPVPGQAMPTPVFPSATPQAGAQQRLSASTPETFPQQTPIRPLYEQARKPGGHRGFIVAIIVLIILLVGVSSAGATYILTHQNSQRNTVNAGNATQPAATSAPATTPPGDAPTAAATPTAPSAGTTPTVTSSGTTITKNLHLTCILNCDSSGLLDVTLNTIVIDTANGRMEWSFTIKNSGLQADTNMYATLYLEDPAGQQYQGGQPGTFTEQNPINTGQTLQEGASFSFLPKSGVTYTLHLGVLRYDFGTEEFQTEEFSF